MELVSGVISTHNRTPDIVERALKSILGQTYTNIEVIVVDDSTSDFEERDEVKSVVESYSDRNVRYIRHEKCQGACAARNTGLAAANGEIIGFLDDDDEWLPEKVEKMLPSFADPEVGLVYSHCQFTDDSNSEVHVKDFECHTGYVYDELLSVVNFIGSTSFPLLRKKAVIEAGGFDILMQSSQDLDMWIRVAENYKVDFVDAVLNNYHVHTGDRITTNFTKRVKGTERLIEKNIEYLKKHKPAYYIRCNTLVTYYSLNLQSKEAFSAWLKCVALCPCKIANNFDMLIKVIKSILKKLKGR